MLLCVMIIVFFVIGLSLEMIRLDWRRRKEESFRRKFENDLKLFPGALKRD